ncbi:hypothetical protein E2C01_084118 [Portunus trituberculatus]|uniref:Uncharacterized protein n=1 Tax=Portunus trituberculatus TaxID=210409 RepID=A0A5B7J407_PORTR|nr:hypothetical protein [Portunus trituberculatus]
MLQTSCPALPFPGVYGRTPIQRLHRQQVLGDSQLKLKLKLK